MAYQKASEGFEVAKVAGAMAAEVPGDFWADSFPREPGRVMYPHNHYQNIIFCFFFLIIIIMSFFSNHYHVVCSNSLIYPSWGPKNFRIGQQDLVKCWVKN